MAEEAAEQRKLSAAQVGKQSQVNAFNAITRVHERLSSPESYEARVYLNTDFIHHLNQFLTKHTLKDFSDAADFNEKLRNDANLKTHKPLEKVERVLLDFDIIDVPLYMGVEITWEVAKAYRVVILKTSKALLPFMEIQRRLRGQEDPSYKMHYLYLLDKLMIPLPKSLPPPRDPNPGLYRADPTWRKEEYSNPLAQHAYIFSD